MGKIGDECNKSNKSVMRHQFPSPNYAIEPGISITQVHFYFFAFVFLDLVLQSGIGLYLFLLLSESIITSILLIGILFSKYIANIYLLGKSKYFGLFKRSPYNSESFSIIFPLPKLDILKFILLFEFISSSLICKRVAQK